MSHLERVLQELRHLTRQELKFLILRVLETLEERAARADAVEPPSPAPLPLTLDAPVRAPVASGDDIPLELLMTRSVALELNEEMAEDQYLQGLWPPSPE